MRKTATTAVPVRDPAGRNHQRGEHDRVGAEHPGDAGDATAAEVTLDLRERDVDDEHVESDDEHRDRHDGENLPATLHVTLLTVTKLHFATGEAVTIAER